MKFLQKTKTKKQKQKQKQKHIKKHQFKNIENYH